MLADINPAARCLSFGFLPAPNLMQPAAIQQLSIPLPPFLDYTKYTG